MGYAFIGFGAQSVQILIHTYAFLAHVFDACHNKSEFNSRSEEHTSEL